MNAITKDTRKSQDALSLHKMIPLCFIIILVIGLFARLWQFGHIPGGINQDEAFSGYEAYSILHYGKDSSGYRFPVYLTAWGSGMNALNSYLMIPFIALFGLKNWVIRIPQVLVAVLSLIAVYFLVKKIFGAYPALFCMFFTAIAPWHIFLSRWGLESNLAPGFLLFGLCFFIYGLERPKLLLLSAGMYGLSLYCYATIWPFVPLILILQAVYCLFYKKLSFSRELLFSILLLGILALPLLLFLLVNMGIIPEICLPFLSIPRLLYMRSGEISFQNIPENFQNLWQILSTQTDGLAWNATDRFGIFYPITLPFFLIGLLLLIRNMIRGIRHKAFCPEVLLLVQLLAGFLLGLLIHVNINRVNCLFLPMLLIAAYGLYILFTRFSKYLLLIPLLIYSVYFIQFEQYYFTDYAQEIAGYFCDGLENAVQYAMQSNGTINVTSGANYARVMFYSREDVNDYISTVQYTNYPSAFLDVASFGRFCFYYDLNNLDPTAAYIVEASNDPSIFTNAGYQVQLFGNFYAAIPPAS